MYCGNCFQQIENETTPCPYCGFSHMETKRESNSLQKGVFLHKRYFIGRILGFGGFGITYLAFDQLLKTKVAIKEYLPNEFATRIPQEEAITVYSGEKSEQFQIGKEKFIEEARRLVNFQNARGIVHCYDCFEENGTAYISMEYLQGHTMKEYLETGAVYDPNQAAELMLPVLDALEEVHKIGMLHRDIAPDNIFVTDDGVIKLIDFGAARFATTSYSRSLSVIIKPGYAPEEQYRSRGDQGPWTDIYGIAATMYKMITGITPEESLERGVKDNLKSPKKLGFKVPENIENTIMNGLNLRIEDRPQNVNEFRESLQAEHVKRNKKYYKKMDVGLIPLWVKAGLTGITGVIMVSFILLITGVIKFDTETMSIYHLEQGKSRVPNFVNIEMEAAKELAGKNSVGILIEGLEYSKDIPKDRILSQTIYAGETVDEGTMIGLIISGGEEPDIENLEELKEGQVRMESVQFKALEEAIDIIQKLGLNVKVFYKTAEDIAINHIISQGVEAGEVVDIGSTVTLWVSGSEEEVRSADSEGEYYEAKPIKAEQEKDVQDTKMDDEDDYDIYESDDDYDDDDIYYIPWEEEAAFEKEESKAPVITAETLESYVNPYLIMAGSDTSIYGVVIDNTRNYSSQKEKYASEYGSVSFAASYGLKLTNGMTIEDNYDKTKVSTGEVGITGINSNMVGHLIKASGYFSMKKKEERGWDGGSEKWLAGDLHEYYTFDGINAITSYTYYPNSNCTFHAYSVQIIQ